MGRKVKDKKDTGRFTESVPELIIEILMEVCEEFSIVAAFIGIVVLAVPYSIKHSIDKRKLIKTYGRLGSDLTIEDTSNKTNSGPSSRASSEADSNEIVVKAVNYLWALTKKLGEVKNQQYSEDNGYVDFKDISKQLETTGLTETQIQFIYYHLYNALHQCSRVTLQDSIQALVDCNYGEANNILEDGKSTRID